MTTKISISLQDEAVLALDRIIEERNLPSRSAAIQEAIALLASSNLQNAYARAWQEWDEDQDNQAWNFALSDGL